MTCVNDWELIFAVAWAVIGSCIVVGLVAYSEGKRR
jgi:uncharacterized membrane protein